MSHNNRIPQEPSDFMTELLNALHDFDERVSALSPSRLMLLPDDDLRLALDARISHDLNPLNPAASIHSLDTVRRSVYVVDVFDAEVQAQGLDFFLSGENRFLAPLVAEAFREIGAIQQAGLFDRFVARHKLDFSDSGKSLDAFPLAQFDTSYRELNDHSPVGTLLISYAREHIDEF